MSISQYNPRAPIVVQEPMRLIVCCLIAGALMGIGFAAWVGWINPTPEQVGPCCDELLEYVGGESK